MESDEYPSEEELNRMLREVIPEGHPFYPFAIYDPNFDWIIVQIRDCSASLIRVNDILELLEDNNPRLDEGKYAGFHLEQVIGFMKRYNIEPNIRGEVDLDTFLDQLEVLHPEDYRQIQMAKKILWRLGSDGHHTVCLQPD